MKGQEVIYGNLTKSAKIVKPRSKEVKAKIAEQQTKLKETRNSARWRLKNSGSWTSCAA